MKEFLQAMLDEPSDMARLILCDWLEDQGDPRGPILRGANVPSVASVPSIYKRLKGGAIFYYEGHELIVPCFQNHFAIITHNRQRFNVKLGSLIVEYHTAFDWKSHTPVRRTSRQIKVITQPLIVQVAVHYFNLGLFWPEYTKE